MLDTAGIIPRIEAMLDEHESAIVQLADARELADQLVESADAGTLAEGVDSVPGNWLLARPLEDSLSARALSSSATTYAVAAVDGSQISADRHEAAFCYLLNTGSALIVYSPEARAELNAQATLHFREEEVTSQFDGESHAVTSRLIGIRRSVAEYAAMESLLERAAADCLPAVGLIDGSLILWPLEVAEQGERARAIERFNELLSRARVQGIPIAGYISHPGSRDFVNTLRAFACGFENAQCRMRCPNDPALRANQSCDRLNGLTDRSLFERTLHRGERSPLFGSRSKVLGQYSTENKIAFFYLNVGHEVARIEIPMWVAESQELVERVHAIALDQCEKGRGYPVALTEAHEQAIVRGSDRTLFFEMVERMMIKRGIRVSNTRKALAKRARAV